MRKSFVAILFLAVIAGCFLLLKRSPGDLNETANSPSPAAFENSGEHTAATELTRPRWNKPSRPDVSPNEVPPPSNAILYGPADFARGELQNIVVDDGIKLGDNAAFVPRSNPNFRLFGNFISPEIDSSQPFDLLNLNLQASALGENEVTFEIRTRSRDGFWSEWQEVSPERMKEPLPVESPKSTGWQFRVVLFANDSAGSPKVETISVEPVSNSQQNFSADNNAQ
ncbi:MAG: hypothetical protein H0X66_16320 [Verrucomicrobia bacterium]|nr:hypothetical protein [Verrucomicrobiota bacterium]